MGWKEGINGTSHGICEDCYEKEKKKMGRKKLTSIVEAGQEPGNENPEMSAGEGRGELPPDMRKKRARRPRMNDLNALMDEFKAKKEALVARYMKRIQKAMAE
jgi:hypothetical protein